MTNEEAIKWLTLQKNKGILWDDYSDETKGIRENAELRIMIAYEMAIETLEQQPCEDCISRQAVLDYIYNDLGLGDEENGKDVERQMELESSYKYIKSLSSVTPQEPKTGHWIVAKGDSYLGMRNACCSNCKDFYTNDWGYMNYCPNCGARMTESEEKE